MLFRNTRRWIAVALGILLPVLSALWTTVLSSLNVSHPFVKFVYVGLLALAAATAGYISQLKPARDLEKPVLAFLNLLGAGIIAQATALGISPRLNLMLLHRPWWVVGRKRLTVVWGLGMDNFPDVRFSCMEDGGVAGEALTTGSAVLSDCETMPSARIGLTPKQIAQTSHVTVIWSWPIYQTDSKGQQTGKRIGTVNLDGITKGDFATLEANGTLLQADLRKFRDMVSTIV